MSEQLELQDRQSRLERAFARFDKLNPRVWTMFCLYANQAIEAKVKRIGVALIVERIRWQTMIETTGDKRFKVNNNHRAYYVRKWQREFPQHKFLFATRTLQVKP